MKKIIPLVALFLLCSVSATGAFAGSLHEPKSPENAAESISPLLGTPVPTRMACSRGSNANDDYVTTAKDTPVTFSPLWNDSDTPQQNFGGIISGPQHGTAEQVGLDAIKYTPATGYTGSDSITYLHIGCLQCSGSGSSAWCSEPSEDSATVYITVTN
jgi:hypothetical protein